MSSEWHSIENSVELTKDEVELIQETIPHLSTLTSSVFGNLEEFDQYGGQASFFNTDSQPVGIKITYALFGDHQIQLSPYDYEFEQFNKIALVNEKSGEIEYVAILLNRNSTIKEIQTNISVKTPYSIYKWLVNAYKKIDFILNYPENFYLDRDDYRYHGPEEISDMNELKKQLNL